MIASGSPLSKSLYAFSWVAVADPQVRLDLVTVLDLGTVTLVHDGRLPVLSTSSLPFHSTSGPCRGRRLILMPCNASLSLASLEDPSLLPHAARTVASTSEISRIGMRRRRRDT